MIPDVTWLPGEYALFLGSASLIVVSSSASGFTGCLGEVRREVGPPSLSWGVCSRVSEPRPRWATPPSLSWGACSRVSEPRLRWLVRIEGDPPSLSWGVWSVVVRSDDSLSQ